MMHPTVLFFLFGLCAGLLKSDLRVPSAVYDAISMLLLLSIGLKGGEELARQDVIALLPQLAAVLGMGLTLPLIAYPALRFLGRLKREDAASIAAHYGSVSVGTYAVAAAYLARRGVPFEEYMPVFVAVLEAPAIVVGVLLAKGVGRDIRWKALANEVLLGRSVVLLFGGLLIGWIAGPEGLEPVRFLFFDLFGGILALFLLEMGIIAAAEVASFRRYGLFLIGFGIVMPLVGGAIGVALGWALGMTPGGAALLGVLGASASYIAVPAAMRLAVPEANPTLSIGVSLGITFPFNITAGIPLYQQLALFMYQT